MLSCFPLLSSPTQSSYTGCRIAVTWANRTLEKLKNWVSTFQISKALASEASRWMVRSGKWWWWATIASIFQAPFLMSALLQGSTIASPFSILGFGLRLISLIRNHSFFTLWVSSKYKSMISSKQRATHLKNLKLRLVCTQATWLFFEAGCPWKKSHDSYEKKRINSNESSLWTLRIFSNFT